jgi:hypothetical protein
MPRMRHRGLARPRALRVRRMQPGSAAPEQSTYDWRETFIEKEIDYYRATYTSIEERAGFSATFASGLAALLILWASNSSLRDKGLTLQVSLFVLTLVLLGAAIFFSVSALKPRAGRSIMFGASLFGGDMLQFYRGARTLTRELKAINSTSFADASQRIIALEQAWLLAEPKERYVKLEDLNSEQAQEEIIAARLTLLMSFRRHVQLKAFYVVASIYTLIVAIVVYFFFLIVTVL